MPNTANFSFPYPTGEEPADGPSALKALAEKVDSTLHGVRGDATLANDSTLTVSSAIKGLTLFQTAPVTRTGTSLGAFSTPIILEIPAPIKAGSVLEVRMTGVVKASVESNVGGTTGGTLGLVTEYGTTSFPLAAISNGSAEALAANTARPFYTAGNHLGKSEAVIEAGLTFVTAATIQPLSLVPAVDMGQKIGGGPNYSPLALQLHGSCSGTGTITLEKFWMRARVI